MLHRIRAQMHFPEGHWGPQWCKDQMAVRYSQAVHIRQGEPAEERAFNTVRGDTFECDLALMDEAAALDAIATLSDQNVFGQTITLIIDGRSLRSLLEYHLCDHNDDIRTGCSVVVKHTST